MGNTGNPLISIYVPCHNGEKYLARCLDSITGQIFRNFELIVIDNLSTDNSLSIAKSYAEKDSRIRIEKCERPGLSAVRNEALKYVRGECITSVDCDDEVSKRYLSVLISEAMSSGADMVMGGTVRINEKRGTKHYTHIPDEVIDNVSDAEMFFLRTGKRMNHIWGKLYRRELFDGISFPEGKSYEDLAVMPYILKNVKKFKPVDTPLYYYHIREDSITGQSFSAADIEGLDQKIEVAKMICGEFPELSGYANDCILDFSFYLLGKISGAGFLKYRKEATGIVEEIKKAAGPAAFDVRAYRPAVLLTKISPRLAGKLFSIYSSRR